MHHCQQDPLLLTVLLPSFSASAASVLKLVAVLAAQRICGRKLCLLAPPHHWRPGLHPSKHWHPELLLQREGIGPSWLLSAVQAAIKPTVSILGPKCHVTLPCLVITTTGKSKKLLPLDGQTGLLIHQEDLNGLQVEWCVVTLK